MKSMIINGKEIEVKKFATKKSAENFMSKKTGREIVFSKSHEYYVSI